MAKKLIENEFYHIYNRGVGRQQIFHDAEDYQRFLKLMYLSNSKKKFKFKDLIKVKKDLFDIETDEKLVEVSMYTLMPNHFHIFISSPFPKGGDKISLYIKKISTGYAQYYNKKYNRTGTLFESKFKAEHVETDEYLKYLFSYIHLNPVKLFQPDWKEKGIKNSTEALSFLNRYLYSSYNDYFSSPFPKGGKSKIIEKQSFLKMLPKNVNLQKDIFEWIKYKKY